MAIQKFTKYTLLKSSGVESSPIFELELKVLEKTGNYFLHKDLLRHSNSLKQGTFSTKTRSEIRGGGRKPWQQKGSGRARAGSNRSPLWKGGGVIFGPKPKTTVLKSNKKERKLALQTLFYNKKKSILIIEDLEKQLTQSKTKKFLKICKNCRVNINQKLLVIVSEKTMPLKLATQNLKNVELIAANNLNTLSLLKANQIMITLPAIKNIKEIYCD
jgi:large subunit ribosomal protein L4